MFFRKSISYCQYFSDRIIFPFQAAVAWALGQIGRHTPEHAKSVAIANVLPKLLSCYLLADSSEDLQSKVKHLFSLSHRIK